MPSTPKDKTEKIPCDRCTKLISRNNMAVHKRSCGQKKTLTYEQLSNQLKTCTEQLEEQRQQLQLKDYKIETLEIQVNSLHKHLLCKTSNQVINNTTNNINVNVNYYYVLDKNGMRDGLDMTKIRTFGHENVSYVDLTQPLPNILKDIYMNPQHPENRVLSHHYLNLQWILIRYKDHVLRLHLERDRENIHVMLRLVCDNVEKLLGKKYNNTEEKVDATWTLLSEMDKEVRDMEGKIGSAKALDNLPIWNRDQFENVEARMWTRYMDEPTYSQNELKIYLR